MTDAAKLSLATRLAHVGRTGGRQHGFVNPPVHRGSTMLYPSSEDRRNSSTEAFDRRPMYGITGGATHHALEDMVASIEGGTRCQIVPNGLAAASLALLAVLKNGDHCLLPDSSYGPTRSFADNFLGRMGVTTTYYDPEADADGLAALIRPETRVLYTESPGSQTFEMQDIPALSRVAHARGLTVILDNTWGIGAFQPFAHGVDLSVQALTKYVGGHSDIMLGAVTVATDEHWEKLRSTAMLLGYFASPDDCWLALRGARTMGVRLDRQLQSGLKVAEWLSHRPEVARVLHPALPGAPGHAIWKRDYTGGASLFAVEFAPKISAAAVDAMIDSLSLFGIGSSWGGFESLAVPTTGDMRRTAGSGKFAGPSARFHIGLEDPAELIADLDRGLEVLRAAN
ncbi:cystathionine beta-lyase [Acidisphaera sp. L21]|uniref:cystathionine beta-lyase n=1 Tax=Acidisphaera sp. L21 TaxID=1641851 RepID=UPI0015774647|nr:cystathionine beta-lyase [Acidisphaera sp. L21]